MERSIKEYLGDGIVYHQPYKPHDGSGSMIGGGDMFGNGKAYTYKRPENDYNGSGILSFNGKTVYHINGYTMLIKHIREPWALAEIIKNDFTLQPCYIGKINKHIAVGSSLKDVLDELRGQIFKTYDNEDDIARAFVAAHPLYDKEYDWEEMVSWHSLDKTSCADGRKKFTRNAGKRPGSCGTPRELISYMKKHLLKNWVQKWKNFI